MPDSINHCPDNITADNMQAISAPYNFVPLADWVHIPDWSKQVSHDWPFQDGISGEIHYKLVAESPLLVGAEQKPASANAPGEVSPYQLPHKRYAIPGSSLKGMLRSVVEIAGFGRMRMVDDLRPGLRDITGKHVSQSYTDKIRGNVRTGFLRKSLTGELQIIPCKMVRLHHRDIEDYLGAKKPVFPHSRDRKSVKDKYTLWKNLCRRKNLQPGTITFDIGDPNAKNLGKGSKTGTVVLTGQISDSTKPKGKKKDFIFYDRIEGAPIPVPDSSWRDFLLIHGDDKPEQQDMSWPGYWKNEFRSGTDVPVFFLQDGDLLRIGLAYMPKLAGDFTIHNCISHANERHLEAPGIDSGYDLSDLLFGSTNPDDQNSALKSRVSFSMAVAEKQVTPKTQPDTILNGPKPTYFPNYIEQKTDPSGRKLNQTHHNSPQYATYIKSAQSKSPVIRGFKRYPARSESHIGVQQLSPEQIDNKNVQVSLNTLPVHSEFNGRINFHNLKPEELGALLWALTWGGDKNLRHSLGMGKSFGFGQVRIKLDAATSQLIMNDPGAEAAPLTQDTARSYIESFVNHMEKVTGRNVSWSESPQISNLISIADPASSDNLPNGMRLTHMCMHSQSRKNEFVWAKQKVPFALPEYQQATKWITRHREAQQRRQEAERIAKETADKLAKEEEALRKQEAFDALSESEQSIFNFRKSIKLIKKSPPSKVTILVI
ncbi:MAG: TIGR03986 family type III CRISPR-associated RAMP protein [Thiotrichales bacterium]